MMRMLITFFPSVGSCVAIQCVDSRADTTRHASLQPIRMYTNCRARSNSSHDLWYATRSMTFTGAQVRPTERHFFYNHTGYVLRLSIGTGTSIAIASFIRKRGRESVNRVTDLMVHLRSEQDTIWRLYDLSFSKVQS
jgi:hypothetical protein